MPPRHAVLAQSAACARSSVADVTRTRQRSKSDTRSGRQRRVGAADGVVVRIGARGARSLEGAWIPFRPRSPSVRRELSWRSDWSISFPIRCLPSSSPGRVPLLRLWPFVETPSHVNRARGWSRNQRCRPSKSLLLADVRAMRGRKRGRLKGALWKQSEVKVIDILGVESGQRRLGVD
jgi:hypothetical protein